MSAMNYSIQAKQRVAKIEISTDLHPIDHQRAVGAARVLGISQREFFALAIHFYSLETWKTYR
jgi:acid stress-induced BolA-like protein IbaG/YrbA